MHRGLYSGIPSISDNGRFVAFESPAPDLVKGDRNEAVDVFLHDRKRGKTTLLSVSSEGTQGTTKARSPRSPPTTGDSSPSRLWPRAWSRATAITQLTPSSAALCAPLVGLDGPLPKPPLGRALHSPPDGKDDK